MKGSGKEENGGEGEEKKGGEGEVCSEKRERKTETTAEKVKNMEREG